MKTLCLILFIIILVCIIAGNIIGIYFGYIAWKHHSPVFALLSITAFWVAYDLGKGVLWRKNEN